MQEHIENNQTAPASTSELAVRREKLAALIENGQNPYEITKYDVTADSESLKASYVDTETPEEGELVRLGGRMVSRRVMGKASFAHLLDRSGKMQLYVRRDEVGEEDYAAFKKWDIGDIIGVEGYVFRTVLNPENDPKHFFANTKFYVGDGDTALFVGTYQTGDTDCFLFD